jgi:hypothetical protein
METENNSGYTIELTLADKLAVVRRILSRQKVDVMKAISVKANTWRDWEAGRKIPTKPTMKRLSALTNGYIQHLDDDRAYVEQANKKLIGKSELRIANPFAAMLGDDCDDDSTHEVFEAADLIKEFGGKTSMFARKYPSIRERAKQEGVKLHELWGVTPASISHWRNGFRQPTPEKVAMLIRTSWGILTAADFVEGETTPERKGRGRPRKAPAAQEAPFAILMPPPQPQKFDVAVDPLDML